MKYPVNTRKIKPDLEFYTEVLEMNKRGETYLESFKWCKEIRDSFLYLNLGSTLCIFLFEIDNSASSEDDFLWVMVGDLPSMYLDVYGSKTTVEVLKRFKALAKDWVSNVKSGLPVNDCYPFNAAPTLEMAEILQKRIDLIRDSIIPNVDEIELPPSLMILE